MTIELSDYYNKVVQVQLNVKVVHALQSDIFHHLNNGAAILHAAMRLTLRTGEPIPKTFQDEFLIRANSLNEEVTDKVTEIMTPVQEDMKRFSISSLRLLDLVNTPDMLTRENFDALSAFNDRLNTVCTKFHQIRRDTEVDLLRASGFVPPDFTV